MSKDALQFSVDIVLCHQEMKPNLGLSARTMAPPGSITTVLTSLAPQSSSHVLQMPGSSWLLPCSLPWLLPCSLLLSSLPTSQSSPCQEVVDPNGSVYGVEQQMGADSKTCQQDSPVFTNRGRRFCFTDHQAVGSVFTGVRCKGAPPPSTSVPPSGPVCQTLACKKFSERVLAAMDTSVEPCQDFHKFACGKFKGEESISELQNIFKTKMVEILREPPNPSQDPWEQHLRYTITNENHGTKVLIVK